MQEPVIPSTAAANCQRVQLFWSKQAGRVPSAYCPCSTPGAGGAWRPWSVDDGELNAAGDVATAAAGQLSPLGKLGSALTRQLMKVVDEGVGPVTGSRDYAEARLAHFGDPERAIRRVVAETTASSGMAGFSPLPVACCEQERGQPAE